MKISSAALVSALLGVVSACSASTAETSAPGATQSPCRVGYLPQESCLAGAAPATAAPSSSRGPSGTIGARHTVTIATFTGNGDTSTSKFTIGGNGNWVLKYAYDCLGQPGGEGPFEVVEDALNNGTPSAVFINRLGAGGKGSWHVYGDAGHHYLQIVTECRYTISVVQKH